MGLDIKANRTESGQPMLTFALPEISFSAMPVLRLLRRQFPAEFEAVGREIVVPAPPAIVLPDGSVKASGQPEG